MTVWKNYSIALSSAWGAIGFSSSLMLCLGTSVTIINQPVLAGDASEVPAASTPSEDDLFSQGLTPLNPAAVNSDFRVTQNGFFVRLINYRAGRVNLQRSADGRQLEINLEDVTLPESLLDRQLTVNSYGVERVQFTRIPNDPSKAQIVLDLNGDSPNWQASLSDYGGLTIVPTERMTRRPLKFESPADVPSPLAQTWATVQLVELRWDSQLIIQSDRPVQGRLVWDRNYEGYRLEIPNAQYTANFRGPEFGANSPIAQLRVRQEGSNVVILFKLAPGVTVGAINQLNRTLLMVPIIRANVSRPPINSTPTPTDRVPLPSLPRPNPEPPLDVPRGALIVVIDPGHGGKDPGAIGLGGLQEKDVILPISLEVSQILQRQGIRVLMTRQDDRFISLDGRVVMANRARANLFVSIHANSMGAGRPDISGIETYYYSSGLRLAQTIHNTILERIQVPDRRVRRARFYVLRHSAMPSVLVEVGFVTGYQDAPRLRDPAYRSQMAQAIAAGIIRYIQQNYR